MRLLRRFRRRSRVGMEIGGTGVGSKREKQWNARDSCGRKWVVFLNENELSRISRWTRLNIVQSYRTGRSTSSGI
jgi:hypothetical protein